MMPASTTLTWLGNSCFLVRSRGGKRILIDPFSRRWAREDRYGLREPRVAADIVLVTHEDSDHNAVEVVPGSFFVIRGDAAEREVMGVRIRALPTFHGTMDGAIVKDNTVFVFSVDGVTFCHMGDFAAFKHRDQARQIAGVDVLMVPIGGRFSLDWGGAWEVIAAARPRVAIPMHYDEFGKRASVLSVDGFIHGRDNVTKLPGSSLQLDKSTLAEPTRVYVFTYE